MRTATPRFSLVLAGLPVAAALLSTPAAAQTPAPNVFALAVDPRSATVIYAATEVGVFRSIDAGGSWRASNNGLEGRTATALAVDSSAPAGVYAATDRGVLVSKNGGAVWSATSAPPQYFTAMAVGPDSSAVYAASIDLQNGESEVLASLDRGATWIRTARLSGRVTSLAVDPFASSSVWLGISELGVQHSTDGGLTFSERANLNIVLPDAIVFDPRTPGTFFVGGPPHFGFSCNGVGGGALKTTDGGTSFRRITLADPFVSVIAVDPSDSAVVFASTIRGGPCNAGVGGVHRSRDGGSTWFEIPDLRGLAVTAIAIAPTIPETVLVATRGSGILRSVDGGNTWQRGPGAAMCASAADRLCLQDGRFQIRVRFRAPGAPEATARAVALSGDAGYFWFFTPNNVELAAKVVDGRSVDGHFWLFAGSLSNVQYTILVTDLAAGTEKSYENPPGRLASIADTTAF